MSATVKFGLYPLGHVGHGVGPLWIRLVSADSRSS